jgi:hypothetical protein
MLAEEQRLLEKEKLFGHEKFNKSTLTKNIE